MTVDRGDDHANQTVPTLALAALTMSVTFGAPTAGVSAQNVGEKFTAFAINMNSGPKTATVDIKIDRWSTDAEREQLLNILVEEKDVYRANQALLKAIQKLPKVGYLRTPETLGWDIHYARQNPMEDGGRQIVVATDRPVGFREARNQPRTMDYPFTVIEMRLNKEDKARVSCSRAPRFTSTPRPRISCSRTTLSSPCASTRSTRSIESSSAGRAWDDQLPHPAPLAVSCCPVSSRASSNHTKDGLVATVSGVVLTSPPTDRRRPIELLEIGCLGALLVTGGCP